MPIHVDHSKPPLPGMMLPGNSPPVPPSSNDVEVRAIIENGLNSLREWMHMRLQHQRLEHQEDMKTILDFLRVKSTGTGLEFPSIPMGECSRAVKDTCPQAEKAWASDQAGAAFDGPAKVSARRQDVKESEIDQPEEDKQERREESAAVMNLRDTGRARAWEGQGELRDYDPENEADHLPGCVVGSVAKQIDQRSAQGKIEDSLDQPNGKENDDVLTVSPLADRPDRPANAVWQSRLMEVFEQLDTDKSGTIDMAEMTEAFEEVGLPKVKAFETFMDMVDKTGRGSVDRARWLQIIDDATRGTEEELGLILDFLERLEERQRQLGKVFLEDRRKKLFFIIRHDSYKRMAWDVLMMLCLGYISLMLPFSMGFGKSETMEKTDLVLDVFFCVDICMNFRTTYVDNEDATITDGCAIAKKYLTSWFFLDFFSSVPFEELTSGLLPSFQPARLLKIGKVAKVMKLLRISKMLQAFEGSPMMEKLEESTATKAHQTALRVAKLALVTFVIAHWLACFACAVDGKKMVKAYFDSGNGDVDDPQGLQEYIVAVYWAMTTLSTVGYGDISPLTDESRIFTVFAMVLGGAFYGYIIGSVTSVISDMDVNGRNFYARMDLVQSWIDCHEDIPKSLRRRLYKHMKVQLAEQTAISDADIFRELSPELCELLSRIIIHAKVREHVMFNNLPSSALPCLVAVLKKTKVKTNEFIVKENDPGIAMYILVEGAARYGKGEPWRPDPPSPVSPTSTASKYQPVNPGDSFGEEIVFGMEENYMYSIVAAANCVLHHITEDDFTVRFKNMPDLVKQMRANFLKSRAFQIEDESLS